MEKSVVIIGNFDGIHLGHKHIIRKAQQLANDLKKPCSLLSFYPHPTHILLNKKNFAINSFKTKFNILKELGIDKLVLIKFDREFANQSPQQFIQDVLLNQINPAHIVVGKDFAFGSNKQGNIDILKQCLSKHSIDVSVIEPYPLPRQFTDTTVNSQQPCSSSLIREFIQQGNVKQAAYILGRSYFIEASKISDKNDRNLSLINIKLKLHNLLKPKDGLYLVEIIALENSLRFFGLLKLVYPKTVLYIFNHQQALNISRFKINFLDRLENDINVENNCNMHHLINKYLCLE